ncbi:MAG: DUF523 domain-containing protein [Eubacteriaceae bacterium]|nr:DUF523 domain-containing protein [Eubacteriaceae bacterium]
MDKGPLILNVKLVIGISACCMGAHVRYNSKGWDMLMNLGREKSEFVWCPVCPEVFSGMGVPRDPIHISGESGKSVWQGEGKIKSRSGKELTENLKTGCQVSLDILKRTGAKAYIYMDGSPTCGVYRTTLKNKRTGKPPGVFGALLHDEGYFLIPATDLQSPVKWWDWKRRLLAFLWLQDAVIINKRELYEVWYKYKFLCQELDEKWAREKGRELAALKNEVDRDYIENFRNEILELLRKPSTLNKIVNRLWKHYSHYRKVTGETIEGISGQDSFRNATTAARELNKIERASEEKGIVFGTSPVILRGNKNR